MKKIYNYNNLKCSVEIAKLRLSLISNQWHNKIAITNIEEEKEELRNYIEKGLKTIKYIEEKTKELNNIELDLFKLITCENINITKAIDVIASKYYLDNATIWKIYYPTIKPIINNLVESEDL